MDARDLIWDIRKIFKYDDCYQEHCGDGIEYYDCELLIDFGPFTKGTICKQIDIESSSNGDFSMFVHDDNGGAMFVPVWTYVDSKTC